MKRLNSRRPVLRKNQSGREQPEPRGEGRKARAARAIIVEQPATAEFLAGKIYGFLVRDELLRELRKNWA
jgi:hypothetical protein